MASFSGDYGLAYSGDFPGFFGGGYAQNLGLKSSGRSGSSSSSLVLDNEKGELVNAPARLAAQKGTASADVKAKAALKSHSEAERRRRERINSHLSTLRRLVPNTDKMDKAALLAEVISQVRELKRNATEISNGYLIPSDVDEVRVEHDTNGINQGGFLIKASLCCEDRPELLTDLRKTLQVLSLKTVRAEVSTLGGRIKNVFFIACDGNIDEIERRIFARSVHHALKAVLDRIAPQEFSQIGGLPNKRRRNSPFESSSSSS